ncbi:MAG: MFS transporter [Sphingobium sp.]
MANTNNGSASSEWRRNWTVVLAATAGMSLASLSSYSIGIMMAPIEQDLGWSRLEIASGLSITAFCGVTLSTCMGWLIDRIGARRVAIWTVALLCGALMLMSTTSTSIWSWWSLWLLVGLATSAMPTVWTATISGLFSAGRGLALAVVLSGTGISASLVPMIGNYFVEHFGWRSAYLALGGCWALVVLPLVIIFFREVSDPRQTAEGGKADPSALPGLTVKEGFQSSAFYKIALVAFLFSVAGVSVVLNYIPILSERGISRDTAAGLAGIVGIATVLGKLIGGHLLDRIHAGIVAAAAALLSTTLPVTLLILPGSVTMTAVATAVFSLASGANFGAVVYLAGRYFGQRSFGVMFGTIHALLALGTGLGPLLSNRVYDVARTYDPVLGAVIPAFVLASLLLLSLGRYPIFSSPEDPKASGTSLSPGGKPLDVFRQKAGKRQTL